MTSLMILLAPSANRVYAGAAEELVAAELQIMLGEDAGMIEPITLAGIAYLQLNAELDDRLRGPSAGCRASSPRTPATMIICCRSRCRDLICSTTTWSASRSTRARPTSSSPGC